MFDGIPLVDSPLRWLLSIVLIISTPLVMFPVPVLAWGWQDLWLRRDQQAAQALQHGDFPRAAELAEDPLRKGAAAYRHGDYQQALDAFAQARGAQAHYNRGNALAQLGRLEEARDAYQAALDEQPGFEDARYNRDLVEDLLRQQQQQQQNSAADSEEQNSPQQQESSKATDDTASNTPDAEDSAATQDQPRNTDPTHENGEQQDSEAESATSEQSPGQAETEQQSAQSPQDTKAEQQAGGQSELSTSEQQPDGEQPQTMLGATEDTPPTEEQQAMDQWLERIPDDPGGLLRRKFLYQYRSRGQQATDPNAPAW